MSENHDSEFFRLVSIIIGALVVFTALIIIAANMVFSSSGLTHVSPEVAAERAWKDVQPVGVVKLAGDEPVVAAAPAAPKSGKDVYTATCLACHSTGAAGAPKVGDTGVWNARMANGLDAVMNTALNGKGAMPPRGGDAALSDAEVKAAVEYMLTESGVTVAAEAAPVEATSTDAAPAVAAPAAAAGVDLAAAQKLYQGACFACHGTGAAGAPKLGDKAAWAPRIAAGMDALMSNAINGKGAMPPKGGRADMSDDDIAAIVAYMVSESK